MTRCDRLLNMIRSVFGAAQVTSSAQSTVTFSDLETSMMDRALELAGRARDLGEVPVGAIVYRTATGEILGEGFNTRETEHNPVAHAEITALSAAARTIGSWRLHECTLVVTLEPCIMCAGACVNARIGRVIFGTLDPKAGGTASLYQILEDPRLNHRAQVAAGLRADESARILRDFFRNLRK